MQGYVDLLIASMITLELSYQVDLIFTDFSDAFGYTMALGFFIFIVILPLFLQRKLRQKFVFVDAQKSSVTT
jgi:hypothetical protein